MPVRKAVGRVAAGSAIVSPGVTPCACGAIAAGLGADDAAGERARRLLEGAPDPMLVLAMDGRIEQLNARAATLFGFDAEELVGRPVEILVPFELQTMHRMQRTSYADSDHPGHISTGPNVTAVRKDGTTVAVEINLSMVTLSTGQAVVASIRDVTESRRVQRELARARDFFRGVLNGASEQSLIATDTAGRITVFSRGASQMTGYAENQMLGITPLILHDPEELARRAAELGIPVGFEVFSRRASSGRPDTREWTYVTADGDRLTVLLSVTATFDDGGRLVGYIEAANDITQRKRVESQLRDSEQRFRLAFDGAPIGMFLTDLRIAAAGQILKVNRAMCTLTGHTETELLGSSFVDLFRVDDRGDLRAVLTKLVSGGTSQWDGEKRGVHADGHDIWVQVAVSVACDEDGLPAYAIAQLEDITARKRDEARLEERFRELSNNVQVGFALRQLHPPETLYANPAYFALLGFDPAGPAPSSYDAFERVLPADRARVTAALEMLEAHQHVSDEVRIMRPGGSISWVHFALTPVADQDGTYRRVAAIYEDVTERREAIDAVRAAQTAAEQANAGKDKLLARMNHELRTPLNAMLGFAQLLELDVTTSTQEHAVQQILRSGERLLAMIDQVLDINSIDADRLEAIVEPVHVARLLTDTIALMQTLATENDVDIRFDATQPDADRCILADLPRIRQAILNLLSNAIKYNHPGGQVDVTVDTGDHGLSIHVTDDGIGIPAEYLPRLFQPFDRLGRQTSDVEGTGVGLALSKRLITLMGGSLNVRSDAGQGSSFTVTMPVADDSATGSLAAGSNDQATMRTARSCVLYIEDNASNVELLTGILKRRPDWTMVHAGTGARGLELAAQSTPAAILLDLRLPDIDGIDVLRALRARPDTADVPVAVLSADASPEKIEMLLEVGAEVYLTKPLDVQDVLMFLDAHSLGAGR